jgi:hypothetical protein
MDEKIRVALIYGSIRKGRFCDKIGGWAAEQIAGNGRFSLEVIDPAVLSSRVEHEAGHHHDSASLSGGLVLICPSSCSECRREQIRVLSEDCILSLAHG